MPLTLSAHLLDAASALDGQGDLVIEGERIVACLTPGKGPQPRVELPGLFLLPGLIDLHTHLRTPGQEEKEDLTSGGLAAARGGFTTVVCMPNTTPALDNPDIVAHLIGRAEQESPVNVLVAASVTVGNEGRHLTDFRALAEGGAMALSDDAWPVQDAALMRLAMVQARKVGLPLILHCEHKSLSAAGVVDEGAVAERLGVKGLPASAEEVAVARNALLAVETGARAHLTHLTTPRALDLLAQAKKWGGHVTGDVCPHHLLLGVEDVERLGPLAKVNPPLRPRATAEALRARAAQGGVDAIATDHAPHTKAEKSLPLARAPFGIVGLETALALLHGPCGLGLLELTHLLSAAPARILGLGDRGQLQAGRRADLIVVNAREAYQIRGQEFASKAKFTPFEGWEVRAKVVATLVGGRLVHCEGALAERLDPLLAARAVQQ